MFNDEELIELVMAGDERAKTQLYKRFHEDVYRIGILLTHKPEDAADFTQEVFLRIFRGLPKFRRECPLRHWILAIAARTKKSHLKAIIRWGKTFLLTKDGEPLERPAEAEESAAQADCDALRKAIMALPSKQQTVLVLHWFQGLSFKEIENATGINQNYARTLDHRARKALRKALPETPLLPADEVADVEEVINAT